MSRIEDQGFFSTGFDAAPPRPVPNRTYILVYPGRVFVPVWVDDGCGGSMRPLFFYEGPLRSSAPIQSQPWALYRMFSDPPAAEVWIRQFGGTTTVIEHCLPGVVE